MSVFSDEWRRCLREQYKYVIRNDDRVTLPSLTHVLNQVGFTEDELTQLRVEATMRVEDNPEDFVPDLSLLQRIAQDDNTFQPHPLECQCPECVNKSLIPHDADGQPIEVEDEEELRARLKEQQEADDDDNPQQLSLF